MRRLLTILSLILLLPFPSMAQWSFDVPSIEAYIADHKDQRSLLLARSALEQGNVLLHQYSSDANAEYKAINVELDKYTRAFDVIDLMYQTLRTSLNTYDTYETFKQRIEDYKVMLTAYWEKCLSHGDIVSTDTLIISVNRHLLEHLAEDGQALYRSFSDLVLYATGAAACRATDLMAVVTGINGTLDMIKRLSIHGVTSRCASVTGRLRSTWPRPSPRSSKAPTDDGVWQEDSITENETDNETNDPYLAVRIATTRRSLSVSFQGRKRSCSSWVCTKGLLRPGGRCRQVCRGSGTSMQWMLPASGLPMMGRRIFQGIICSCRLIMALPSWGASILPCLSAGCLSLTISWIWSLCKLWRMRTWFYVSSAVSVTERLVIGSGC